MLVNKGSAALYSEEFKTEKLKRCRFRMKKKNKHRNNSILQTCSNKREKKTAIKQATFPVNDKPKAPKHSFRIVNVFFPYSIHDITSRSQF